MKKGFTLLELLIVIGILAILATVVALVLNPAELLRQARDSQRLSDLRTINSAVGLWVASASSTTLIDSITATTTCTVAGAVSGCTTNDTTGIDGSGWVRGIKFTDIPGGSPLSRLPLDPVNNGAYYYAYSVTSTAGAYLSHELNTNMESQKYSQGGAADVESKDGGNDNTKYEVGTKTGLDLI